MSQFAAILLLAFFSKLLSIGLCARIIMKKYPDILASLLGGWLLVQCFLIAWMLFLSSFHGLSTQGIWFGLGALNLICLFFNMKEKRSPILSFSDYKLFFSSTSFIALLAIIAIFSILFYRSLYFYDNTADAFTYGLTRIEFYANYKTLFTVQPTPQFNIFSNEWNGELNALFYLLATANDQASSFGNVEIWLVSVFGYAWLSGLFLLPARLRLLMGVLLSSTPVLLGLVLTVKGDALAIIGFAIALGFTLRALASNNQTTNLDLLFALAALGITCGAKITVLPYVSLIILLLGWISFKAQKQGVFLHLLAGTLLFLIGNSRYILNYFAYGSFFKHIESTQPSIINILDNLKGIVTSDFQFSTLFTQQPGWVLSYKLGFLAFPISLCFCYGLWLTIRSIFYQKKITIKIHPPYLAVFLCLGLGFCFLLITLRWYAWSFRYFCPYLMLAATFMLAWPFRFSETSFQRRSVHAPIVIFSMFIIIANNYLVFSRWGEVFPVLFEQAMEQTELERKVAFHPYFWSGANGLKVLGFEKLHSATILIFTPRPLPLLPFFGKNHQNRIELVNSLASLEKKAAGKRYQMLVFSKPKQNSLKLTIPGYAHCKEGLFWIICTQGTLT